jgi:mono/diheme cytochrome c family protein
VSEQESNEAAVSPARTAFALLGLVVMLVAAVFVGRQLRARTSAKAESVAGLGRGEILFQTQCAKCHGPDGHGDAEAIARLNPPPRDFSSRPWKTEPTAAKIREVIAAGIPGTAMPSSSSLSEADLQALVEHVLQLASQPRAVPQQSPADERLRAARFLPVHSSERTPELQVVDAHGERHQLHALPGRLILLNFWGTNCEHCLKKLPQLAELHQKYRDQGFVVWNICADLESAEEAQAIVDRVAPGSVTMVDESGLANHRFEVHALPTVWLVGSDGRAIARSQGVQDWMSPAMQAVVEDWLAE